MDMVHQEKSQRFFEEEFILKALLESASGVLSESDTDSTTSISNSDEDDDNEHQQKKRIKIMNYLEDVVRSYSREEFKAHFRIEKTTTYKIIDMLDKSQYQPKNKFGRREVTAEKSFLITLWYLSNMETYREIGDRFGITESSACRIVNRVVNFLISISSQIIKWPNGDSAVRISNKFAQVKGLKNVIGCIDASHIEIPKPKDDQDAYCNRKGYHSLILQAIVDCDKKMLDVFCGEPGSMNDARVFRKSGFYKKMFENDNYLGQYFILGDSAYPNLPWLVSPFIDNGRLSREQKEFNYFISATRIVVEQAFGLLKGRFRRLRKLDNKNMKFCSHLIMAACILHNICIDHNDILITEVENDSNQPSTLAAGFNLEGSAITQRRGAVFREMFPEAEL